jgi:hypothetical protein
MISPPQGFGGGGGVASGWVDDGTVVRLDNAADSVAIGVATLLGAEKLRVTGGTAIVDFTSTTAFQVTQTGGAVPALIVDTTNTRVGIGIAPTSALHVSGTTNVVGEFQIGGIAVFESDRDLAASLVPNADASLSIGTIARRFNNVVLNTGIRILDAASDTWPIIAMDRTFPLSFGAGGASQPDCNFWRSAAATVSLDATGGMRFNGSLSVYNDLTEANAKARLDATSVAFGSGAASALDAFLLRVNANHLAMRNGVNNQRFDVYASDDGVGNSESGWLGWAGGPAFVLGTSATGTGSNRAIHISPGGTNFWSFEATTPHILASTDNAYNIGAAGANRPANVHVGTQVFTPIVGADATARLVFGGTSQNAEVTCGGAHFAVFGFAANTVRYAATGAGAVYNVIRTSSASGSCAFICVNDASNVSDYCQISFNGSNVGSEYSGSGRLFHAGTPAASFLEIGSTKYVRFMTGGVRRWDITNAGHILAFADNTYNIGAAGATRPANIHVGTNIFTPNVAFRDTSAAFDVTFGCASSVALDAGRTLTFDVVNGSRTLKLAGDLDIAGNLTTAGAFAVTLTSSATTSLTLPRAGFAQSTLWSDPVATGNVGAGEDILMTYDVPANTLYADTRIVKVTWWGTCADNANVKTVKCYFGSLVDTHTMTASQIDQWRIVLTVVRSSSGNQEYRLDFDEDGSAEQHHIHIGTLTETDTAAITAKLTGEATADDDIVCRGMTVENL